MNVLFILRGYSPKVTSCKEESGKSGQELSKGFFYLSESVRRGLILIDCDMATLSNTYNCHREFEDFLHCPKTYNYCRGL